MSRCPLCVRPNLRHAMSHWQESVIEYRFRILVIHIRLHIHDFRSLQQLEPESQDSVGSIPTEI
jgi:hypothetical protein